MERRKFLTGLGALGTLGLGTAWAKKPLAAAASGMGIGKVRYAAVTGSDLNDGLSWEMAKRTVAAAVKSLGTIYYSGRVYVGPGTFMEWDLPIPFNTGLHIIGSGNHPYDEAGTVIKLANGVNNHLFAPEDRYTGWGHYLAMRDLTLHGNNKNISGPYDLLQIRRGGYNTELQNVFFAESPRHGLNLLQNGINLHMRDITAGKCNGSALHFDLTSASVSVISLDGGQFDECSPSPIKINWASGGYNLLTHSLSFSNVKFESKGLHQHCIHVVPTMGPYGGAPLRIHVSDVVSRNYPTPYQAIIYEENGTGKASKFLIQNTATDHSSSVVFRSDKTGQQSTDMLVMSEVYG